MLKQNDGIDPNTIEEESYDVTKASASVGLFKENKVEEVEFRDNDLFTRVNIDNVEVNRDASSEIFTTNIYHSTEMRQVEELKTEYYSLIIVMFAVVILVYSYVLISKRNVNKEIEKCDNYLKTIVKKGELYDR